MNNKFVVSHMDQQMGPFDEQELKSKWAKGEILAIDYIYDEAQQDWLMLSERFQWAKAEEVSPPPPVRTDVTLRRMSPSFPTAAPAPAAPAPAMPTPAAAAASTQAILVAPPASAAARMHAASLEITQPNLKPAPITESKTASGIKIETETPANAAAPFAKNADPQPAKIKLIDGMGEIDLSPLNPGKVELVLQDAKAELRLQEPHRIHVKPAEPVEIVWTVANQQTVGHEIELTARALDEHGNVCLHYTDNFILQIRGGSSRDITLTTQDGQAGLRLSNTKAETWNLSLEYSGGKTLKLPEKHALEWQPGPAARLVLDGPHEYIAGIPLKVRVKAVDSFGNVAKNFQGLVSLEVKAS